MSLSNSEVEVYDIVIMVGVNMGGKMERKIWLCVWCCIWIWSSMYKYSMRVEIEINNCRLRYKYEVVDIVIKVVINIVAIYVERYYYKFWVIVWDAIMGIDIVRELK